MPAEVTKIADCLQIAKTFERASAYAVTEASAFALLGPVLDTMRIQTQGFMDQYDTTLQYDSAGLGSSQTGMLAKAPGANVVLPKDGGVEVAEPDRPDNLFAVVARNFTEPQEEGTGKPVDATIAGNFFNSECIPCGARLNLAGEVEFEVGISMYIDYWKEWLIGHYKNLLNMIEAFSLPNKWVDICALLKFMSDFVCIPDLSRMMAALMALMERTAFEINGVYDLIMQLVGPLLQPFLSNFVSMVERYIMMIIAPLECIVKSMQEMLRKIDYNILFKNIDKLDKHLSFGRKTGDVIGQAGPAQVKGLDFDSPTGRSQKRALPFLGFMDVDLHEGPERQFEADFNLLGPVGGAIKAQKMREQRAVEKARDELRAINRAASQVDGADPEATERYMTKRKNAEKKYRDAKKERDLSEIGELSDKLGDTFSGFKSSIMELMGFLRKAASAVQGFFQDLVDELIKIMNELLPTSGGFIQLAFEKMALVQMISWIASIIKAFQSGINCDGDIEDIQAENFVPAQSGMKIWTDQEGLLHIQEDDDHISDAINTVVQLLENAGSGSKLPGNLSNTPTESNDKNDGIGSFTKTPSQKLKGLVEFTGNPALDTSINSAIEKLTTPKSAVFKCPLQTTADQANQVNQWIREVNTAPV